MKRIPQTGDQVRLACFECGKVARLAMPLADELKAALARIDGFEVQICHLEAGGLCRSCSRSKRKVQNSDSCK